MSAFGLEGAGGGSFRPIIKYNAKAGRIFRMDRKQDAHGQWYSDEVDITQGFEAIFDFSSLEAGYARFSQTGPDWIVAKFPFEGPAPVRPDEKDENGRHTYKPAFRMTVILSDGDEREFGSNASIVVSVMAELYTKWAPSAAEGLPAVSLVGVKADKAAHGNFRPTFEIIDTVPREDIQHWIDGNDSQPVRAPAQRAMAPTSFDDLGDELVTAADTPRLPAKAPNPRKAPPLPARAPNPRKAPPPDGVSRVRRGLV
jgi:hypothetical protein